MKGEKLQEIVIRYLNGDAQAVNDMQPCVDPMIIKLVSKYKKKCDYEDLYQTAWLTVMKCLNNYNPEAGILFSTYCYKAICNDLIACENRERKNLSKYDSEGNCIRNLISKDIKFKGGYTEITMEETIADTDYEVDRQVIIKELTPVVYKVAESLSKQRRKVVYDYLQGKKQCEIAKELNVSYAYICIIIREFIDKCGNIIGR